MTKIFFIIFLYMCMSCSRIENLKKDIDYHSFGWSGGTVFSEPSIVTTKEIHFDTGNLLGNEIIIEGRVETIGKYDTHLVISDEAGRMLIVLTHIEDANKILANKLYSRLKVLGSVERGKKGLPYVLAKSLNLYEKDKD